MAGNRSAAAPDVGAPEEAGADDIAPEAGADDMAPEAGADDIAPEAGADAGALAAADDAALEDALDGAAVLLELQADSTRAAVATPAINDK